MNTPIEPRSAIVVMGVSGSGKSTVGAELARLLGAPFLDADDLHTAEAIARMASGIPLTDADRAPWLRAVGATLAAVEHQHPVIACSALRRSYRDVLRDTSGRPLVFVHLTGSRELLARRLTQRTGHFMQPTLLESQLEAQEPLEPDEEGVVLDVTASASDLAVKAQRALMDSTD